ncbi:MAG: NlpC/P60 family protein [Armatimonadota bacterium]
MASIYRRGLSVLCLSILTILATMSIISLYVGLMSFAIRMLLVGTLLFAAFTVIVLLHACLRHRRWVLMPILILLLASVAGLYVTLHIRSNGIDRVTLRSLYIKHLNSYLGAKYSWGGETKLGIDCSGLARTALIQAMAEQGWQDGNARTIWPIAWRLWWRDTSARGMYEETYGYTRKIGHAHMLSDPASIRMRAGFKLQPGDLAVTDGGAHVMIYTGNGRWIEANPSDGRVVKNKACNSDRAYFNMPVTIVRWWTL